MATLVLTAVGTAIGGPVGGAIGGILGNQVDRAVLTPGQRREGPRLSELRVQTSSYGTQIAKLFGTMRVAGTVIWSTDLIESRTSSRAGKGQPGVTAFSYSVSFAVLLSGRPIRSVGRIWAEGKLLRGAAGDWKGNTGFRLHPGGEDQDPDPLIASAVGRDLAPAYRGCAYAVFEAMQLADYGNRIPSLTFEVMADDGVVEVATVARSLAGEVRSGPDETCRETLHGFAATGGSVAGVLDTLATLGGGWWAADRGNLVLRGSRGVPVPVPLRDGGVSVDGHAVRRSRSTAAMQTVPRALAVSHYDPQRDYQIGVQRTRRPGAGTREERIDLPAALPAEDAKARAEGMLRRAEAERIKRVVALGLDGLAIGAGQLVTVADEGRLWRVASASVEGMVTRLTLVPVSGPADVTLTADAGRAVLAVDQEAGRTLLAAFEMPALDDVVAATPRLAVVAAGSMAGWRRAALMHSLDGGASWIESGATAGAGVIGTIVEVPGQGSSLLVQEQAALVVELAHAGMTLRDADRLQLDAGRNLARVGDELLQFSRAEPLNGNRWRLTQLIRGRGGSEAAIGSQSIGDPFALVEDGSVRFIDLPLSGIGSTVRVVASGVGDEEPQVLAIKVAGTAVLPPSPVDLRATPAPDGAVTLRWTRRSRAGWRWIDGVDVPLVEEAERYLVTVQGQEYEAGVTFETAEPMLILRGDAVPHGPAIIAVRQRGTHGDSPASYLFQQGDRS